MQKIIIIFSVLAMLLLREECHGQSGSNRYTAGINYTVGVPAFVPQGNVSRVAIDTGTMKWYEYAQVGGWRWSGDRVQDISGCSAPAYTPTKGQSRLVLNACTEAQNGHGPELYKYTGSAWLCLNCGGNYTAGDGIDITGTEITNTGDLSTTNELQTLSISNDTLSISDGNSVVLPGGGVTWPLLAPSTIAPSYSFSDYPNTGLFSPDGGVYIYTQNGDTASNVISIYAGSGIDEPGGPFEMSAGGSTSGTGGYFLVTAGDSQDGTGGGFTMSAGNSNSARGGDYNINAGNGGTSGGNFYIKSGDGISKAGGIFNMSAGASVDDTGGGFFMQGGESQNSNGGKFTLLGGLGTNGGDFEMGGGYGTSGYGGQFFINGGSAPAGLGGNVAIQSGAGQTVGNIELTTGTGFIPGNINIQTSQSDFNTGDVNITSGDGDIAGNINIIAGDGFSQNGIITIGGVDEYGAGAQPVIFTAPIRSANYTTAQKSTLILSAGVTVFCTDCTANDSSTGVLQTYNGTAWKNHW